MAEFIAPDFIQESDEKTIHDRMMENLPSDIDGTPGGFPWDFTRPAAIEIEELVQRTLARTVQLMFPQYAWGQWLDLHGSQVGLTRKEGEKARGKITIKGAAGTEIKKSFGLCTQAVDSSPSIVFFPDEDYIIPECEVIKIGATAEFPGIEGNVMAGTITLMVKPITGIHSVTNEEAFYGGDLEESDEAFRNRIQEANESVDTSFVGNNSDLKRWAKSVVGIEDCIVFPTWEGPGTVKLELIGKDGKPAEEKYVQAVIDYIVSPSDPSKRLLPAGCCELTVKPADTKVISYSCRNLILEEGVTLNQVIQDFKEALRSYYEKAKEKGTVKYNLIHALLTEVDGVLDFTDFLMNNAKENIELDGFQFAATGEVTFEPDAGITEPDD